MANAPNTQSTLGLVNGVNKTSTALSTNILIMVNNTAVGAVQSLNVQERRDIRMIDEVGTDGHVDSVPNKSSTVSGSCQRIRFDRLRIAEAFGRGFIHARSQVYPFDIMLIDQQKRESSLHIVTVIKNVWITGIEVTYQASDWVISDTMNWQAETIFSHLSGDANAPVARGGERGIQHFGTGYPGGTGGELQMGTDNKYPNIEQLTDMGKAFRRGSLDAAGLIDIGDSGVLF
jgi:hypothetical protein